MEGERANTSDYRSKMVIFFACTSLDGFDGVWWSWYATGYMRFCMFCRVGFLRFAELVQAGVELCYNVIVFDSRRKKSQVRIKKPLYPSAALLGTREGD